MLSRAMSQVQIYNQIDRLVTSSTPSDALLALAAITDSIRFNRSPKNTTKNDKNQDENEEERRRIFGLQSILAQHYDFIKAICSLLSDKSLPGIRNVIVDGGDTAACEFLLSFLSSLDIDQAEDKASRERLKFETNAQLKKLLSGGSLTHAILDLLSHPTFSDSNNAITTSLYAKTSAIQILSKMTMANPTLLHAQILNAPDGLPRVIDLLKPASLDEESIRNEALLLCTIMAKTNPGSARLMIFGETYDKVFDIATDENVDNAVKGDCLKLCIEMTLQDEMGSEVFLGNGRLVRDLTKFLDLRFGVNFVRPEAELHDESDDLDDILNGGSGDKGSPSIAAKVPFLTKDEEQIMLLALELFRVLVVGDDMDYENQSSSYVSKRRQRQKAMLSHDILCRLLIDMALYTLPPPDSPHSVYVSAVPTLKVQLLALDVMAALSQKAGEELQDLILSKRGIYLNVGVLDRLMYLICTGDGANRSPGETAGADEISIHSLGVLRCLLNAKEASLMMMHAIAPPPPEDDNSVNVHMGVHEVQKLVNTLGENLHVLLNEDLRNGLDKENKKRISRMIIGSAGALGIFLTSGAEGTTREMLLRVPIPPPPSPDGQSGMENGISELHPSLIECIMRFVEVCSNDQKMLLEFRNVISAFLRILCEWVPSTRNAISAVLTSASSISLGVLLQLKISQEGPPLIPSLSGLLLGLCMENMDPSDELGGWSISSIMNLINVGLGIGKFTQLLESTKAFFMHTTNMGEGVGLWGCSEVERSHFIDWYKTAVSIVRRKAIQELTLSGENDSESDADATEPDDVSSRDIRALRKLVRQQTSEIQALKEKLHQTEETVVTKSAEVKVLNKRLESNPSQLDDLLNECTAKISELEIQNRALTSKITFKEGDFKETLRLKDETIAKTQEELKRAREETRVALEDKVSLKEELSGLSVAYSNLEEEYNKISVNTCQPTGADSSEGVTPMSSYQIVKDDNAKLKNDIRAANDWMKKAVKKMDELNRKNAELEKELKLHKSSNQNQGLTTSLEYAKPTSSNYEAQQDELARERDLLRQKVEKLTSQLAVAESRIQKEEGGYEKIASLSSKIKSLEDEIVAKSRQYSGTVSGLEQGLASKDQFISELEKEMNELREKLARAQANVLVSGTEEPKELQQEIEKLSKANKSAQEWMANAVKHHKSLKKQVQDLKEENSRLSQRKVYETDISSLQKQVQDATVERDLVRSQLVALESKLVDLQNTEEKKSFELTELNAQLEKKQNELCELKNKLDTKEAKFSLERRAFVTEKEKILESLQYTENELDTVKKELEGARIAVEKTGSDYDERNEAFCKLTVEVQMLKEENIALVTERDEHLAAIEDMKNRLTEFHSWTETAQLRITELESEKDLAEFKLKELQERDYQGARTDQDTSHVDSRAELDAAKQRLIEVEAELITATNKIRDLESKVISFSGTHSHAQNDSDEEISKNLISQLEREKNEALERSSDALAQILVLETMKDELDAKLNALQEERLSDNASKQELEKQLNCAKSELESTREVVSQWEATYELTKSELSSMQIRVEELENEKNYLNSMLLEVKQKNQEECSMLHEEISRLRMQIGDLDGRNRALIEENKDLEEVNHELNSKLELLDEVEENLFEKENDVAELTAALEKEKTSLIDLQHDTDRVIKQWTDKSHELEEEIARLNNLVVEQQNEAKATINLWEERCTFLENEVATINNNEELERLKSEIALMENQIRMKQSLLDALSEDLKIEKENVSLISKERSESEKVYKEHIEALELAINEHLSANDHLQDELDNKEGIVEELENKVKTLMEEIISTQTQSEEVVIRWQENSKELEDTIVQLENTIEEQKAEAIIAIEQWETRCNDLTEQVQKLESDLENEEIHKIANGMKAKLKEKDDLLQLFKSERDVLLQDKEDMSSTVDKLNQDVEELKLISVRDKEEAIRLQDELNKAIVSLEDEREKLKTEIDAKDELEQLCTQLRTQADAFREEATKVNQESADQIRQYEAQAHEFVEAINTANNKANELEKSLHTKDEEIEELKTIATQLEFELREANDALQSHITDEVTVRATEKAAAALRSQIKELREKQIFNQQEHASEKEARLSAEAEVEQLRKDIRLIVQATGFGEGEEGQIHMITSKAAAEIMHREREEIDALQKNLDQLVSELKASKMKEQDAEDRAANSRLHASVCEQELLSMKSNVDFLQKSLDESRQSELDMRILFEKRIKDLEEECRALTTSNQADLETLKTELSNVILERDQLIRALNESEKANSTLVYSTTVDKTDELSSSTDVELAKLRMENAHLLSEAAKSVVATERRIRTALGGELFLEDRVAREDKQRLAELQQLLTKLKTDYENTLEELGRLKSANIDLTDKLNTLEAENAQDNLKRLEEDFSRLEVEKISLETKLKETVSLSKSTISNLEEKYRAAEAKIRKLESSEQKEAALAAEIARLREENQNISANKNNDRSSVEDVDSTTERKGPDMDPSDQLDLIRELQSEMKQEREMYQDLLAEHEDLLALLAQQDCEKKCLQQALAEANGNDAVEKAILEAEQKVIERYGKYVQI